MPSAPTARKVDDDSVMTVDDENKLHFPKALHKVKTNLGKNRIAKKKASGKKVNNAAIHKVLVPPHRLTPLKNQWTEICGPLVNHLKLQVRMNLKAKCVELRSCAETIDTGAVQKGIDFVKAFTLGFDVQDALALLRLEDIYMDSFEIKDVRSLAGDHLARAIGRIAGKDGKTKFAIENTTKTRIVLADTKIHILGSFANIRMARDAVVRLIVGTPAGKVYGNLRTVADRSRERM